MNLHLKAISLSLFAVVSSGNVWALSPPNATANIPWTDTGGTGNSATFNGVADIEAAFNHGRRQEEIQLLGVATNALGTLDLPSQAVWDTMTDDAKGLLILNEERQDRAGMLAGVIGLPLAGIESHMDNISKKYGDLLHDTDETGHNRPSGNYGLHGPFKRIEQDADIGSFHRSDIVYAANSSPEHTNASPHYYGDSFSGNGACHEFIARSENLAFSITSGISIPLPLERAIYGFIYDDAGSGWGHREAALLQDVTVAGQTWGFENNHASAVSEGFLGIYVRGSADYQPFGSLAYGSVVVMNIFDPVSTATNCHYNATLDQTEVTSPKGKVPTLVLPSNKWVQIGLNTEAATGSTVADILNDDALGVYNTQWVVYSYQTGTNAYKRLTLTDTMSAGIGYWIVQFSGNPVTIDMPGSSSGVYVTYTSACTSTEGCFEIPLTTNGSASQWQMIGYPFRDNLNIDEMKIITTSGTCSTACTLSEASAAGITGDRLWYYSGSGYQALTNGGSDLLTPWLGAWISILPAANGLSPKILIPAS